MKFSTSSRCHKSVPHPHSVKKGKHCTNPWLRPGHIFKFIHKILDDCIQQEEYFEILLGNFFYFRIVFFWNEIKPKEPDIV